MMDTSKAGDDTGRHVRFSWSGAVRPLRSARLTLCRQFRPSPCPTHYAKLTEALELPADVTLSVDIDPVNLS